MNLAVECYVVWHRQALGFGIGLTTCSLLMIGGVVSRHLSRAAMDEEHITRTQAVVGSLETLHALVRDAEVHQHHYVISGDEGDLATFALASVRLDQRLGELASALRDVPRQARRLATCHGLVHLYRDFLRMVTYTRRDQGFDAARHMLVSSRELTPVGEMGVLIDDMLADARSMVEGRREQRIAEAWAVQRLLLLSLALTAVGGFVVLSQVRGEGRRRRESETAMRAALRQVDERVRERTNELSLTNRHLQEALAARAEALANEQRARTAAETANELKDRFLATVSHELRTPLNAIIGWVHIIKAGTLEDSEVEHAIDAIDRNARAQARLIADLLDISRMVQGRLVFVKTPVELRRAVDAAVEVARPAIAAKGLTLEYQPTVNDARVLGEESRLQQIAAHLIGNALKFTPRDGRIEVELVAEGPYALLRVRDTGEGIDPEVLPLLGAPFFQAHTRAMRKGLGLGLALVKELVTLHGGRVDIASEGPGRGTIVTVRLPLTRATAAPTRTLDMSSPTAARESNEEPQRPAADNPPRRPFWRRLFRG